MFHLLRNRSFAALTVTQFLGAFNDNAFKQLVLLLSLSTALPWIAESGWVHEWGQSLGLALFSLPFVLFGVLTGSLSDRVSKRTVMVRANAAEVVVMVLGGLAVYLQRYELLLGALFLMGLQSAFFGPGKYGSIAEMTETRDLSRANGWIQLTTTIAIVIGTALGGLLFERFEGGLLFAMGTFVGISVLGFLSSLALSPSPAMAPDRPIAWNPVREVRRQWALVGRDRPLVLSLLASAFFWLIGAVLMLVINEYGNWLQLPASKIALLLTILSLGIGLGSFLAARLSGDRIESGLIPAGLLGMALCTAGVGLAADSANWLRVCLLGTGISAGLFTIPIRALIQHLPPPDNRGAILGLSEMLDFIGIFLASGLFALFNIGLDLDPPLMMTGVGAITLLFAVGSVFYTAEFALRFWLALLFRTIYRVRTEGIENIPRRGGALLVCNHLSYVDAFLVSAAIGRPVRFMMYSAFFDLPVIGHFARVIGAIPVSAEDTRDAKRASIDRAAKLLREGELVCIFAEGGISRNGSLLGFRKGLERIARAAGTPIVPVALDGVWGSIFSFEGGRFFWKLPKHLNNPVDAWIGKELPSDTPAWKVRSAVQYLLTRSRSQLAGRQDTLSNRFLRSARKHAKKLAVVDSGGTRLTYRKLLQSSLAMRSLFARRFAGEQNVGIFLPPGAGAVIANLAISLSGRSPINLNYSLGHAELQEPMRRAGVKHVISSARFLKALNIDAPLAGEATIMLESLAGELTTKDKVQAGVLSWLPTWLLTRLVRSASGPEALATILFSSGSTGEPKGVLLSHGNMLSNALAFTQAVAMDEDDRVLGVMPFFHSFGNTGTLWAPLMAGASIVYHSSPVDSKRIGELLESERVTISLATPTFYQSWMRRIPKEAFAHVRLAVVGAEKLQARFAEAFAGKYGITLHEGYGCTELAPVVSVNLQDMTKTLERDSGFRSGSVGRPLPGISVRIIDPDSGEELAPDVEGSVLVGGPNVMLGYLDDPQRTEEVMRGDWYDTGDVGLVDRDGFLILTDRRSRFSKIGGEMVPLGRVEEVLNDLLAGLCDTNGVDQDERPSLSVTSVPDERKGERLVVLHTPFSFGASQLADALRESDLPTLYQPRADQYFEVPAIPTLGTGKTDLKGLKDLALAWAED